MAAICQFHQYGHCKFSFPCQDNTCPKRHPTMCKFFAMYRRCKFAERCSFLHCGLSECDQTASAGVKPTVQEVSKLREEVKNLRIENERLRKGTDARLRDAYENQKHLLKMVNDLKEELDVDKATRVSPAGTARAKVEEAKEGIV